MTSSSSPTQSDGAFLCSPAIRGPSGSSCYIPSGTAGPSPRHLSGMLHESQSSPQRTFDRDLVAGRIDVTFSGDDHIDRLLDSLLPDDTLYFEELSSTALSEILRPKLVQFTVAGDRFDPGADKPCGRLKFLCLDGVDSGDDDGVDSNSSVGGDGGVGDDDGMHRTNASTPAREGGAAVTAAAATAATAATTFFAYFSHEAGRWRINIFCCGGTDQACQRRADSSMALAVARPPSDGTGHWYSRAFFEYVRTNENNLADEMDQWGCKIRPDIVVVKKKEKIDWAHARAIFEFKTTRTKNQEPLEGATRHSQDTLAQLHKYVVKAVSETPGFTSLYAMIVRDRVVVPYRIDADHIVNLEGFDADAEPFLLYKVFLLMRGICLDSYSGFGLYQRQVDVRKLREIYVADASLSPPSGGLDKQHRQTEWYRRVDVRVPEMPRDWSPPKSWPYEFWHKNSISHRSTSVARVEVKLHHPGSSRAPDQRDGEGFVPAIIKISHLSAPASGFEGKAFRALEAQRPRPKTSNTVGGSQTARLVQAMQARCYAGIPQLLTHGVLWWATKDSGLANIHKKVRSAGEPPTTFAPPTLARKDMTPYLVDPRNRLFTVATATRRMPTATITRYVPTFASTDSRAWTLPAQIASVIEVLFYVCRPSKVVHGDISPGNILMHSTITREQEAQLLDPQWPRERLPQLSLLVDFGESWVSDADAGDCPDTLETRKFTSGTRLFWSRKSYRNNRHLQRLRSPDPDQFKHKLEPLDTFDAIESALVVLVYLLSRQFKLYTCEPDMAGFRPVLRTTTWSKLEKDVRSSEMGDFGAFHDFLVMQFDDPRLDRNHISQLSRSPSRARTTPGRRRRLLHVLEEEFDAPPKDKTSTLLKLVKAMISDCVEVIDEIGQTAAGLQGQSSDETKAGAGHEALEAQVVHLIERLTDRLYRGTRDMFDYRDVDVAAELWEGLDPNSSWTRAGKLGKPDKTVNA
ncbi:uncharacterized protein PSFLO_01670 [Pseudozyma flocculosa]|uniref:Uncharacterized protein n=1 Tax=Pseudozyma flocculosa TaxID=84751 RepID=A0A5C3EYK2_9BASI|nr:uncharacterized protein PSFLO_01670 [Pseudozyma flocculosa]